MKSLNRIFLPVAVMLIMSLGLNSFVSAAHHEEPIIEVRVYKIPAGKMDEWERFFHDKLVEPQEKAGIKIVAAYRTLEDENLFVWMRQYSNKANMAAERAGFYESEHWLNTLRPELREKGLIEKVEIVYTVSPSK
ncbi:MAG: NIPSNAP family protein [Verrucomicrobia bacterium]|nr:NIPSNAP family protein [Verrucomicrobiota bacterium]MDA1069745.1 NIPSNAP family protein [Verrucomicrobiota bacterium]